MKEGEFRVESWIILGASSSIGRAFARIVAQDGAAIVLAGRDIVDLERTAQDVEARFGSSTQ